MACLPSRWSSGTGWLAADEIRQNLKLLGFIATAQQVAAWARPMCEVECPWLERRKDGWSVVTEYRVTRFGRTDVANRLPALTLTMPWLASAGEGTPDA